METFIAKVKGMHCPSCEMLLQDSFEEAGAQKVTVSWKKGTIEAKFDPQKISENKLKSLIKKEGYEVL